MRSRERGEHRAAVVFGCVADQKHEIGCRDGRRAHRRIHIRRLDGDAVPFQSLPDGGLHRLPLTEDEESRTLVRFAHRTSDPGGVGLRSPVNGEK